jgi:hypothetical protein
MAQVFVPTATSTLTTLYSAVHDVHRNLAPCRRIPSLEPCPEPLGSGSLFESISPLRVALASASARALFLSSELVASLDRPRRTTTIVAAFAFSAVLAAQASASDAISSVQVSPTSTLSTTNHAAGIKVRHGVSVLEY